MADVTPIKPSYLEIIHPLLIIALERKGMGYSTHDGGGLYASATPDMKVNMYTWHGKIAGVYTTVSDGYVTADAPDATYNRIDIVYINSSGALTLHKGTVAAINPTGATDWKKFEKPRPSDDNLPDGVILGLVHIRSTANGGGAITNSDIWMFSAYDLVRVYGEESNESPDGSRKTFTFGHAFKAGSEVLRVNGITMIRGASRGYQASPSQGSITINSDSDAPSAGSVVTLDYTF